MEKAKDDSIITSSDAFEFDPDSMLPREDDLEQNKIKFPLENLGIIAAVYLKNKAMLAPPHSTTKAEGTLLYYKFDKQEEKESYSFVIAFPNEECIKLLLNQSIEAVNMTYSKPSELGAHSILLKNGITKIETISIRQNGYVLKIET